jgi:hypothetical protein
MGAKSRTTAALGRLSLGLAAATLLLAAPPATGELIQKGHIRIAVKGGLSPTRLPRRGVAPITVAIGGRISSTSPGDPPQLQAVTFGFNRVGRLDLGGLPRCRLGRIAPSTTAEALAACGDSLIGSGTFSANVRFPEQSPFPSRGRVLAFEGALRGVPVIFAHVYGTEPLPTSYVLILSIHHVGGTFGTVLSTSLPQATGNWGYVTGLHLKLGRTFSRHGKRHSFLSAGCPAPAGFPGALFPLTRTVFSFVGGKTLTATLTRSCTAIG